MRALQLNIDKQNIKYSPYSKCLKVLILILTAVNYTCDLSNTKTQDLENNSFNIAVSHFFCFYRSSARTMPCHGIEVGPTPTRSVIAGVWNPLNQATAAIGYFSCKKHNIIQQNSYWLQVLLSVVQLNLVERQQVGLKAIGSNPFTTIMQ